MKSIWSILFILNIFIMILCMDLSKIQKQRDELIQNELKMMLGSDIVLTANEIKANEVIMNLKLQEVFSAFGGREQFILSKHFFEYKDKVKETELFKLIHMMPKGAVLHSHDASLLGADYVLELTYMKDLYACFVDDEVSFRFSKATPTGPCATKWQLLKDVRYSSGDVEKFDADLKRHFTLIVDDPRTLYTDIHAVWKKFIRYFMTVLTILCYKPAWEQYFYNALEEYRKDNIMYIEVRSMLPALYDLEGNTYNAVDNAKSYKKVLDKFMSDHPDFYGAKLIYAPSRIRDNKTMESYFKYAKQLKRELPDFFTGFDLVNQEDLGPPNKDFLPLLVEASDEIDYFFHAGETNWNGMDSDENLVDAVALNAKRIGHGFALIKHPGLIEEVKKKNIAIEINLISNSILGLVDDVRNHPLASYLAQGLPVVISSDDRGVWGADPLSHDMYVAFVGVASRYADLRLLKKLALNSLVHSNHNDKDGLIREFNVRWDRFIDKIVRDYW